MQYIDKLIEAVESGVATEYSFYTWRPELTGTVSESRMMWRAYNSADINAARDFNDQVLPGCNQVTVDWGPSGCGAIAVWWPNGLSGDCEIVENGYDVCPARALLTATLKVLRTYRAQALP